MLYFNERTKIFFVRSRTLILVFVREHWSKKPANEHTVCRVDDIQVLYVRWADKPFQQTPKYSRVSNNNERTAKMFVSFAQNLFVRWSIAKPLRPPPTNTKPWPTCPISDVSFRICTCCRFRLINLTINCHISVFCRFGCVALARLTPQQKLGLYSLGFIASQLKITHTHTHKFSVQKSRKKENSIVCRQIQNKNCITRKHAAEIISFFGGRGGPRQEDPEGHACFYAINSNWNEFSNFLILYLHFSTI